MDLLERENLVCFSQNRPKSLIKGLYELVCFLENASVSLENNDILALREFEICERLCEALARLKLPVGLIPDPG